MAHVTPRDTKHRLGLEAFVARLLIYVCPGCRNSP